MEVYKEKFGYKDNQPIYLFKVRNEKGLELSCINYGCIITKILAPDRDGKIENIVLGFDTLEQYENNSSFFGAVVGRFAGRIKDGKFKLDNNEYLVSQNENPNHLHGGNKGFSSVVWDSNVIEKENEVIIEFSYFSPDGEEGYPGNLKIKVMYTLNNENELTISYNGFSDKKTLLNVTNHSYFNLCGNLKRNTLDHELTINSSRFIELNKDLLPTGNILGVEGTAFDFKEGRKVRDGVASTHPQNILAQKGYDHPFILDANHQGEIRLVDYDSGRKLIVETDEPVVVLYTGNKLENDSYLRGVKACNYLGLCLETQGPPDSVNHPNFDSAILEVGKEYNSKTKYSFGLIDK